MQPIAEYDSIKRILAIVITYCQDITDHYDPISDELATACLKQHLSIQDWIIWRRIQVEQMAYHQVTSSGGKLSAQPVRPLLDQYKQAGCALIQLWYQSIKSIQKPTQRLGLVQLMVKSQPTILDPIEHPDWIIQGWKIKFILSDKQLGQVRKQSKLTNWYEDLVVRDTWIERVSTCLNSIRLSLPRVVSQS